MDRQPSRHLSDSSLDAYLTYPESPRSLFISTSSMLETNPDLHQALEYLHSDNPLLEAAEIGDYKRLRKLLRHRSTNVNHKDLLGRTALHFAVTSGSKKSIKLLLQAGISPNIKDDVGMTPLSICLMRNPSVSIANLLFEYGAVVLPRSSPMDTGLFIQFVSLCVPTSEDEKLLTLLVKKGAVVNDPQAPGGRQALHIAAMGNNCRLITILTELGADPTIKNHRGETPKMFAQIFKCKEAYELLDAYEENATVLASCSKSLSRDVDEP